MTAIIAALIFVPILAGSTAVFLLSARTKSSVTGLLLHSVNKKLKPNMSCYPQDRFATFLDNLKMYDIKTITVSQHTSQKNATATAAISFDDGLQSYYDNAYPLLENRGIKSTVFAVAGLVGKTGDWDIMGKTQHMTANMLREVADNGHEIGSHSLTHANLVWLDDDELMRELRDSKAILEDITGTAVRSLSFPFGSWNRRVWNTAKSAGYEYATAYRGHSRVPPEILPVSGVYIFDTATDITARALSTSVSSSSALLSLSSSTSKTTALIMSHFSKGTPICKFRKEYVNFT